MDNTPAMSREDKLTNALTELIRRSQDIRDFDAYVSLSIPEQVSLEREWDDYYTKVHETRAYQRAKIMSAFWKMERLSTEDQIMRRELLQDAVVQNESDKWELTKPKLNDPKYLRQCNDVKLRANLKQAIEKEMMKQKGGSKKWG